MATQALTKIPTFEELSAEMEAVFGGIDEQLEKQDALATPEQQEILAHWMTEQVARRDRLGWLLESARQERDIAAARRDAWASRVRFYDRFERWIKGSLCAIFEMRGIRKLAGSEFTWSMRTNPGRVQITAIEELDPRFLDYTPTPNKERIREAIERGEKVTGAVLIQGEHSIQVR